MTGVAEGRRLAVLGSPIAHSRSPQLQLAAYRELGLDDWSYERREVTEDGLAGFLDSLDDSWRGLSLTMPLKEAVLPVLDEIDDVAREIGAANTVLLDDAGTRRGWNTDVGGIVRAFGERGLAGPRTVLLLGTGATARSTLAALARLGTERVLVAGRSAERTAATAAFAEEVGLRAEVRAEGLDIDAWPAEVGLVASTLPGRVALDVPTSIPEDLALFDVAYGDEPGPLTRLWRSAGATDRVVSGLDMLVHQALLQVRVFVGRDVAVPLPGEDRVLRAMRTAVGGF